MKKPTFTLAQITRKGGLSRSPAKVQAARKNGLLGGRPPGKPQLNGHSVLKESLTTQNPDDEFI